jgi:hypothetical protein
MPARYRIDNWSVSQKEDIAESFRLTDDQKPPQPFDLTGAVMVFKAKQGATVIEASTTNGRITIDDAAAGEWSILIPKSVLAGSPAGNYTHDLLITTGGVTSEFWIGSLTLRPGV